MGQLKIVPYSSRYEASHKQFAMKFWTKKGRINPEYIYWKFRGEKNEELNSFILAVNNNEQVVGQLGLLPANLKLGEDEYKAQWFCDLMVDFEQRGKGVVYKLYEFAYKYNAVSLGSDPSPAAYKSMLKDGFVEFVGPAKLIIPILINKTLAIKYKFFNKLPNIRNLYLDILSSRIKNYDKFFIKTGLDDIYNIKAINNLQIPYPHITHGKDFLRWRYGIFEPFYSGMHCYISEDRTDYFVFRIVSNHIYIGDYYFSQQDSLLNCILFLYNLGKLNRLTSIRLLTNPSKISNFEIVKPLRMRHPTVILARDCPKIVDFKYFEYTYLDSDEGI